MVSAHLIAIASLAICLSWTSVAAQPRPPRAGALRRHPRESHPVQESASVDFEKDPFWSDPDAWTNKFITKKEAVSRSAGRPPIPTPRKTLTAARAREAHQNQVGRDAPDKPEATPASEHVYDEVDYTGIQAPSNTATDLTPPPPPPPPPLPPSRHRKHQPFKTVGMRDVQFGPVPLRFQNRPPSASQVDRSSALLARRRSKTGRRTPSSQLDPEGYVTALDQETDGEPVYEEPYGYRSRPVEPVHVPRGVKLPLKRTTGKLHSKLSNQETQV